MEVHGMEIMAVILGLALSAACGFRVFVPLLLVNLAAGAELIPLPEMLEWLESPWATWVLASATLIEVAAYYIPWVDNALDFVATPTAVLAGVLAAAAGLGGSELEPLTYWAVAMIGGGGTAGAVQSLTVASRLASTGTTAGIGNPVLSTLELGASTGVSALALTLASWLLA